MIFEHEEKVAITQSNEFFYEDLTFDDMVSRLLKEINYHNNPYFKNLLAGEFDREDFIETQIAFGQQVAFFNRAMLIAASRITMPERRWASVANVVDEHHGGEVGKAHYHTIREFSRRVAEDPDLDIDSRAAWPEVRQNVATMFGIVTKGYNLGLAGMAIIERMFADISAWIAEGTVRSGWLSEDCLIHYNLHADLDLRHAEELFEILREDWVKDDTWRYYIYQGMWVAGWSFNNLWEGLWNSRKRRLFRHTREPHMPW